MSADETRSVPDARIMVRQALESGVVEKELTVAHTVERLGVEEERVAGSPVARDTCILAADHEEPAPGIRFVRSRSGGG